jgi:hypothetical protein
LLPASAIDFGTVVPLFTFYTKSEVKESTADMYAYGQRATVKSNEAQ